LNARSRTTVEVIEWLDEILGRRGICPLTKRRRRVLSRVQAEHIGIYFSKYIEKGKDSYNQSIK
jgi:hypothetical protein